MVVSYAIKGTQAEVIFVRALLFFLVIVTVNQTFYMIFSIKISSFIQTLIIFESVNN